MKAKKARRGRPPLGSDEKKSETFLLRLEPGEKKGFEDAATVAGVKLSAWIRKRLRVVAGKELERAGRPVPFIESK